MPGDLGTELAGDILHPDVGVLDDIVQQGGGDGRGVEQLLGQDLCHRDAVRNEVLARHALLAPVGGRAEAERTVEQLEVEPVAVRLQQAPKFRRCVGEVRTGDSHRNLGFGYTIPTM